MASSSTTSRAADRRRQRAASAALAATDADDAVDVNNGTDAELRERLLGVRLLPASVLERIIALRPFDGKADMLQRVNDGQPSARQCIGAKLAQKLHVACLSNGDQLSIVSPISHTPISHTQQARIRFDLGELGVVDASGVDPWAVVGITIDLPNRYWPWFSAGTSACTIVGFLDSFAWPAKTSQAAVSAYVIETDGCHYAFRPLQIDAALSPALYVRASALSRLCPAHQ